MWLCLCGPPAARLATPYDMWTNLLGRQTEVREIDLSLRRTEDSRRRIGNVFPGATLPFGMAKAVADTNSESNQGGFTTDGSLVTGFSSMHDSGTG